MRSSSCGRDGRISSLHKKPNVPGEGSFRSVGVLDEFGLFGLVFRYQGTTFLVFGGDVIGTHSCEGSVVVGFAICVDGCRSVLVRLKGSEPAKSPKCGEMRGGLQLYRPRIGLSIVRRHVASVQ